MYPSKIQEDISGSVRAIPIYSYFKKTDKLNFSFFKACISNKMMALQINTKILELVLCHNELHATYNSLAIAYPYS